MIIRFASRNDTPIIFELIKALADYEKLYVSGNVHNLEKHLFDDPIYAEVIVAEVDKKIVGFALFFSNYSTFLTKPGIYLEDLFVLPEYRSQGIGKALIIQVAKIAKQRGCGRLEWSVLDWNHPAITFYKKIGATILDDWQICRVTDKALTKLANFND